MGTVTNLNSGNDKKIERILESNLIKYDETESQTKRDRYSIIINEIYAFERVQAEQACSKLPKSVGFAYFIQYYRDFEKSLHFFAHKISDEILFVKGDVEDLAHRKFNSLEEFEEAGPTAFIIDVVSDQDTDLARYLEVNTLESDFIETYIQIIKTNWLGYTMLEKDKMKLMFKRLSDTYDGMTEKQVSSYTKSEILMYLSVKNDRVKEFKENYIMEDTSDDELNELIENNRVDEENCTEHDKKIIERMNELFKKYENKKKLQASILRLGMNE